MSRCASSEQLELLLLEQLSDSERDIVEAHVEECAACQRLLAQLADDTAGQEGLRRLIGPGTRIEPETDDFLRRLQHAPPWARPRQGQIHNGASPATLAE